MTEDSSGSRQLRPGLWATVNERYPGSMIHKAHGVPLAPLRKPLNESRVTFISTSGVQPKGTLPFDTVHPVGDYSFRRVPSSARADELDIQSSSIRRRVLSATSTSSFRSSGCRNSLPKAPLAA